MSRSSRNPDRRSVIIPPELWQALELLASVNHTTVSKELRRAAELHAANHGLSVVGGRLVGDERWPPEIFQGEESRGEDSQREEI